MALSKVARVIILLSLWAFIACGAYLGLDDYSPWTSILLPSISSLSHFSTSAPSMTSLPPLASGASEAGGGTIDESTSTSFDASTTWSKSSLSTHCEREAWGTLFSTGPGADWDVARMYFWATLVLRDSIQRFEGCRPHRPFFVLHNQSFSEPDSWAISELHKRGFVTVPLSMEMPYPNPSRPELNVGWLKLAIFNFTTWDRVVILDADMLVLGSMEQAFFPPKRSRLSLITSSVGIPKPSRSVNIGVMSIQPSSRVFEKMMLELHSFDNRTDKPDEQDQGWIEMFFKQWGSFGGCRFLRGIASVQDLPLCYRGWLSLVLPSARVRRARGVHSKPGKYAAQIIALAWHPETMVHEEERAERL
ncbi:unnamed protein product [Effrenium voratum]|nr:unnamed protein product [Effrenium voratum]